MPVKHQNYEHKIAIAGSKIAFVPNEECRKIGKKIIQDIRKTWNPHKVYYHFNPGGHVAALHLHRPNKFFAKFDLENFFYSIGKNRVSSILKKKNISNHEKLAKYSCVKNPYQSNSLHKFVLPYGFVQSPLLATLILSESPLGKYLERISDQITVSVYVDDILLSFNKKNKLTDFFKGALNMIESSNFSISKNKIVAPTKKIEIFNCNLEQNCTHILKERFKDRVKIFKEEPPKDYPAKINGLKDYCRQVKKCDGYKLK